MKNKTLEEFSKETASSEPVPGGGSIAAYSGALAAALSEMVANLTVGKKNYEDVEEEMKLIVEKADMIRKNMLVNIEKDCEAFDKVMEGFKMPKNTEEEKENRKKTIQEGLITAAEVPLEIAKEAFEIMPIAEIVVEKGNKNAVTDGLVSAMLARTAVLSALLNVKINLASIKDEKYVKKTGEIVKNLEKMAVEKEKEILDKSPLK
ncbi:MAG TPA: methenyltetrahydrofolate cyclohydrolase [Clostridiales bacterium]|jgi:formiminotetrahydrofolate cyclodeaminase|nr:methenyltetrahydrofolate cyclohydrolase [Clostridiales bacterium]